MIARRQLMVAEPQVRGALDAINERGDIAMSIFLDKAHPPDVDDLTRTLGPAKLLWDDVIRAIQQEYPPIVFEWKYSGAKYGWSLRLLQKKRRILYLIPEENRFLTAFILGERAVAAVRSSDLPQEVRAAILSATKYAEGTGLRLDIKSAADVEVVKKLTALKMG